MKCDESDKNAPWVFLVAGGYEQERRFSEGVLREARDRQVLVVCGRNGRALLAGG